MLNVFKALSFLGAFVFYLLSYMKRLREYLLEGAEEDDDIEARLDAMIDDDEPEQNLEKDGMNIALVSDTVLYARQSDDFRERMDHIVDAFKERLSFSEITSDRIACTLIFDIYVKHLMQQYVKNIDEKAIFNIATENEIKRILANEVNLKIKGYSIS